MKQRNRGQESNILTEASPCSPCIHAKQCAHRLLACQEFHAYLGTPGSSAWPGPTIPEGQRVPTRALYAKVHAHHPTRLEKAWRAAGQARIKRRGGLY